MAHIPYVFKNREEAGELLAKKLSHYKHSSLSVFGIPEGGIVVGNQISNMLQAPLDVVVARKLRAPYNPGLTFGAIAPGDVVTIDRSLQQALEISDHDLRYIVNEEMAEMEQRMVRYNSGAYASHGALDVAVIVDDGSSTGLAVRAAVESIQILHNPEKIVFASPICPTDIATIIRGFVSEVVCMNNPWHLFAIGNWYDEFEHISEEEVIQCLKKTYTSESVPHLSRAIRPLGFI